MLCFGGLVVFPPSLHAATEAVNMLSPAERAMGWQLLFDGHGVQGWREFRKADVGPRWSVDGDALTISPSTKVGDDLITKEQYENFELIFEWRISEGGNSGVFFHVNEGDHDYVWRTGPEYQIVDDDRHEDGKTPNHRAGANFALHAPKVTATRPVGTYNQSRLIVDHGHVQHWLNGQLIVDYQLWTPEWEALVAASKFKAMPDYGRSPTGYIGLQDHGDRVWFRNIKIKRL